MRIDPAISPSKFQLCTTLVFLDVEIYANFPRPPESNSTQVYLAATTLSQASVLIGTRVRHPCPVWNGTFVLSSLSWLLAVVVCDL